MKKGATKRKHFGYRRIHVMLEHQCTPMNIKKLIGFYRKRS